MIPQTLLWVGLIVAWLVVLVPMLAARHPKVNQVSDATLKTRLLRAGGSAKLAQRRKVRPTATAPVDDEAELDSDDVLPEDDEALLEGDLLDEDLLDEDLVDDEAEAHAYVDSDVDELPVSSPMDGDTTPIQTVVRAEVAKPAPEVRTVEFEPEAAAFEPVAEAAEPEEEVFEAEVEPADVVDEVPADEALTEEVAPVVRSEVERDDAEYDDLDDEPRRRRGGYDPDNDARLAEARFRFRQRVTLLLGVLAVVALGAGLTNVPFAWYGLGAVVLALVVYLTYLRRTVRIETEIRRRRTARLERARRERARESEILDGVPAHLRRGGCVVMEIDDEDPAFDHLPRYRAEEFDFLGGRSDLHEPLQRKVG